VVAFSDDSSAPRNCFLAHAGGKSTYPLSTPEKIAYVFCRIETVL